MPISQIFTDELQAIDATKSFTEVLDGTYGENEFSVSGWELRAGSEQVLNHAACEAMEAMGFHYYSPIHIKRPASVPSGGVTIAKKEWQFPYIIVSGAYNWGQIEAAVQTWRDFNVLNDNRKPVGHTWGTIINAINAEDSFFDNNPTYTNTVGALGFNITLTGADRTAIVNRVAQYVYENMNAYKRYSLDPNDGDARTTDEVCDFISEVAARVHVLDGSTEFKAGVYAYAGHRQIPTGSHPHIYVQVALGFSDLGIGYPAMVNQWGAQVYEVGLREYGEISAQDSFRLDNTLVMPTSRYTSFIADGANAVNAESNFDWLHNCVSAYFYARFWKDPTTDMAAIRSQVVDDIFGGDTKVSEWYQLWWEGEWSNEADFYRIMVDTVDQMQPANRPAFQRIVAVEEQFRVVDDIFADEGKNGRYYTALEKALRWCQAVGANGEIGEYAIFRQLANANVSARPDLNFNSNPHYQRYPVIPTQADYDAAKARQFIRGQRSELLRFDSPDDLVMVDVVPEGYAATASTGLDGTNTYFWKAGAADMYFVGPGSVIEDDGTPVAYGAGLHVITTTALTVKWTGGIMFVDMYPRLRIEPEHGQPFIYFPKSLEGKYVIKNSSRFNVFDGNPTVETSAKEWNGTEAPSNVKPGPAAFSGGVRGFTQMVNMLPFVSSRPDKMLMPRALAEAEFPNRIKVN